MEEALLQKKSLEKVSVADASGGDGAQSQRRWGLTGREFTAELKKMGKIAGPMVAVTVSQYLMQVVSMSMVGHLGKPSLSAVSIASSLANVTGFNVLSGLASALESLCGQAYGAKQYQKIGSYTYCSVISLLIICVPVSLLWFFMDKLLTLFGQDAKISAIACQYAIYLIPALFGFALLQILILYFQSQSLIFPMFCTTLLALMLHICLCWALVHKFGTGVVGAAVALGVSYWFNAILLLIYMNRSSKCEKSRAFALTDVLSTTREFLGLALPSALMTCLEWWSSEVMVLLAGLLANSELETSVLSICLTTSTLHYDFVYGIGAAASIRFSNELGAGNSREARAVVSVATSIVATEAAFVSLTLFYFRHVWGYIYSNEREVAEYFTRISPVLCLSLFMDSLLVVFTGVVRGAGWQRLGVGVNLGAYYLVGVPVGTVLCFAMDLKGKGLWIGVLTGSALQTLLFAFITSFTNWDKQAMKARERMLKGTAPAPSHVSPA